MASSQLAMRLTSGLAPAKVPPSESADSGQAALMKLTIYHNPRCSKSRQTLELIRENGVEPEIIEYLDTAPTASTLASLATLLAVPMSELLRTGETEFRDAGDPPPLADDQALAAWLERHPKVLQRPIVVDNDGDRAIIGRPPENVLKLLDP